MTATLRLRFALLCAVALLLTTGCAQPPQEQLGITRHLVARAYHFNAQRLVPVEYRKAALDLQAAENAMDEERYAEAERLLRRAGKQALATVQLVQQEQLRLSHLQQNRWEDIWSSHSPRLKVENRLKTPEDEISAPLPRPPMLQPAPAASRPGKVRPPVRLIDQVTVKKGETLFSISAEPSVFGDPLLWPLLYQSNRDQIKDPRQIYPGQVLSVPRNLSDAEMERARSMARESNIFQLN